uniref:AlNc14C195G8557 protein n=1 Tax=Albugo laibachii Nc14 TaxID=890382 RepID=F0WQ76_9STRA|nr:AlNc14C195G8557 [Albugo laibachii Nc14]CCA26698.1 AlNc14C403G11395 [Albugo laibachii Nc14]|eukprot:CCA26698.1 AlNc14C403G11395 [Albugo laibachii Nc14]
MANRPSCRNRISLNCDGIDGESHCYQTALLAGGGRLTWERSQNLNRELFSRSMSDQVRIDQLSRQDLILLNDPFFVSSCTNPAIVVLFLSDAECLL